MKSLQIISESTYPVLSDGALQTKAEEVIVEMKAAAMNRRDYWITQGKYPGITYPTILGSDGSGVFDGREVILNPGLSWGNNEGFQASDFQVLGMPRDGTFAESISIPKAQIFDKPAHLSWEEAAALPLAGVTAYRSVFTKGRVERGNRVLISGVGGGVATMALLFSLSAGAQVWVTSSSSEKIEKAIALGASGGHSYLEDKYEKSLLKESGGFDVVIDSSGGETLAKLSRAMKPGGRMVFYGGTLGEFKGLSPQILFWRQIDILGTTMGSPSEFSAMIDFVNTHQIVPIVDSVFPLEDSDKAFDRLKNGEQFGKVVFRIQ